jgi:hypothetical protein
MPPPEPAGFCPNCGKKLGLCDAEVREQRGPGGEACLKMPHSMLLSKACWRESTDPVAQMSGGRM